MNYYDLPGDVYRGFQVMANRGDDKAVELRLHLREDPFAAVSFWEALSGMTWSMDVRDTTQRHSKTMLSGL